MVIFGKSWLKLYPLFYNQIEMISSYCYAFEPFESCALFRIFREWITRRSFFRYTFPRSITRGFYLFGKRREKYSFSFKKNGATVKCTRIVALAKKIWPSKWCPFWAIHLSPLAFFYNCNEKRFITCSSYVHCSICVSTYWMYFF